ncbi:MAG TPA: NUDIX hydrolase [Marmoricola sp.]|nr:NUDIX hydrolase [Marmoricola sp.]
MTDAGVPASLSHGEIADEPMSWPVVASEEVYRSGWVVSLRQDVITRPDHDEQFTRIVIQDPGAVVVLAIDDSDRVVLVRQYRHAARMRLLQLPAGVLDEPGEDARHAAARELREEAGLEAAHWEHLLTCYPTPGKSEETQAFFLARGLREVDPGFEPTHEEAEMTVERVPFDDVVAAVLEGRAQDGPLAIAVLAHDARRHRAPA